MSSVLRPVRPEFPPGPEGSEWYPGYAARVEWHQECLSEAVSLALEEDEVLGNPRLTKDYCDALHDFGAALHAAGLRKVAALFLFHCHDVRSERT